MPVSHLSRAVAVPILVWGMLFLIQGQVGAEGPAWVVVGEMSELRQDHVAATLSDGRVLVISSTTTVADLYDPVARMFVVTGSMTAVHGAWATATRLNDGSVLIIGGSESPAVAEIYDPSSGTFSPTASLNTPRRSHTATLLADGTVLIVGGVTPRGSSLSSAELYDSAVGEFSLVGGLIGERQGHTATRLPNGSVLIAGGMRITSPGFATRVNTAEVFDPLAGSFAATGAMLRARVGHTASSLPTGDVFVAGGPNDRTTEIYDVGTGQFESAADMMTPRSSHTASRLPTGAILLTGGWVATGPVTTATTEVFDPVSGRLTVGPIMKTVRQQHVASVLANGDVLATGGLNPDSGSLASAELYESPAAGPEPQLAGSIPESGVALVLWSGGTPQELLPVAREQGCSVKSIWVSQAGALVGYVVEAPDFVNDAFLGMYPGAALPPSTVLILVCAEPPQTVLTEGFEEGSGRWDLEYPAPDSPGAPEWTLVEEAGNPALRCQWDAAFPPVAVGTMRARLIDHEADTIGLSMRFRAASLGAGNLFELSVRMGATVGTGVAEERYVIAVLTDEIQLVRVQAGQGQFVEAATLVTLDDWHELDVRLVGGLANVSIDGSLLIAYDDPAPLPGGSIGIDCGIGADVMFDDITVTVPERIHLLAP